MKHRAVVLLVLAALAAPAAASAASSQGVAFEAPRELLDWDKRDRTLDEIRAFGVSSIRQLVYWKSFAPRPGSKHKPDFDAADPNAYPAGTWDRLDALVAAAQRGDRQAFEELVRRTARLLFARAYLDTGDNNRAEDLVQETLLSAWRSVRQVTDAAGREVSGNTIVHATFGAFMLSAQMTGSVYRSGSPVEASIRAIDYTGAPQAGVAIELALEHLQYRAGYYNEPIVTRVAATTATTDADGRATAATVAGFLKRSTAA